MTEKLLLLTDEGNDLEWPKAKGGAWGLRASYNSILQCLHDLGQMTSTLWSSALESHSIKMNKIIHMEKTFM